MEDNVIPFDPIRDEAIHNVAVYGVQKMSEKLRHLENEKLKLDHEIYCLKDVIEKNL